MCKGTYSFIPPERMSFIKYLFPEKNTVNTGIKERTQQARSCPHSIVSRNVPLKAASATGSVLKVSEFVIIKGHIKAL